MLISEAGQLQIDRGGELAVKRQAQLLDLSPLERVPAARPVSARDVGLMRRIDELHLMEPFLRRAQARRAAAARGPPG